MSRPGRRKRCILRSCPHHHYEFDSIGGLRVIALRFPTYDDSTLDKWLAFVHKYNKAPVEMAPDTYLCSAHFLPRFIRKACHNEDSVMQFAVPTIPPEEVANLAIECKDMRPLNLESFVKVPPVVYLEESLRSSGTHKQDPEDRGMLTISTSSRKRDHQGELCKRDLLCPQKVKIAVQVVNNTLLKVWSGSGVDEEGRKGLDLAFGDEIEIVEKCVKKSSRF